MKAVAFSRYGSLDSVELRDIPTPTPEDHELLIRVHASSINSWDWEFLNGTPFINRMMFGLLKPKATKQVLGADIAGTVEAVAPGVRRFGPGDAVFGDLWDSWGGFAQYACAPEDAMQAMPRGVTFEQAACVPQAGVLALQGVRKARDLEKGQAVLINGGGGGVGTFAIQLAKLAGAEVTAVDSAHKLEVMGRLGADHVIDYSKQDFTRMGERYDLVLDCQNFRSMAENRRALTDTGTYAMVGGAIVSALLLASLWAKLSRDRRTYALVAEGPNQGLDELAALLEAGRLVSEIDRTFPLEQVPDALRYFGDGRHRGKIAIAVDEHAKSLAPQSLS